MPDITRDQVIEAMASAMRKRNMDGPYDASTQWHDIAGPALTAIEALGLKLVPMEPDEEMLSAGHDAVDGNEGGHSASLGRETARYAYAAMLSASPLYKEPTNG
jgi:hypothetical protein